MLTDDMNDAKRRHVRMASVDEMLAQGMAPMEPESSDGYATMDVHTWFSLTYSNYLVLGRAYLQSMPEEWQHRFVACLRELEQAFAHIDHPAGYRVTVVDERGRFIKNTEPHYNRGRTFIPPFESSDRKESE